MNRFFDLGDVLSISTGCLCSQRHIAGVYDILDYMTGESLMTHQLPRAAVACAPAIIAQHPGLASVTVPEWDRAGDVKAQVHAWVERMKIEHGDQLPIAPLSEWHHINPLQELVELTERPDRIVVVEVPS
jgi:hypothetical protein